MGTGSPSTEPGGTHSCTRSPHTTLLTLPRLTVSADPMIYGPEERARLQVERPHRALGPAAGEIWLLLRGAQASPHQPTSNRHPQAAEYIMGHGEHPRRLPQGSAT